jgi:AcrR family transcriptional regulator
MPALPKTTDDAIADAARSLLETASGDFTMAAVAAVVGVQTPSLYKRFADREALLARLRADAFDELRLALRAAAGRRRGFARIRALALAYRSFALARPRLYALLFAPGRGGDERIHRARVAAVEPVLAALTEIAGARHALEAARTLTAFLHGHVSMLLADAFEYGLESIVAGIEQTRGGTSLPQSRRTKPSRRTQRRGKPSM